MRGILSCVVGVLAVVSAGCGSKPCPGRIADLPADQQAAAQIQCTCPANASGSVWGTGIYTTDSSICAAAVHAGAIPRTGGAVTLKTAPGCPAYKGAVQNGITSSEWASYGASFYFPSSSDGKCVAPTESACPARFSDLPNATSTKDISCTCTANATGTVWGSGIYTTDSSICAAAVHAGAIPSTGGKVTLKKAPGCGSYAGSTQNGVTSALWGSFNGSFYFPSKGDGKCAAAPTGPTACPARFADIPGFATTAPLTCTCPAGAPSGSVWGTHTYTTDSSICAAAVHAGAITTAGGTVTVKPAPGCSKYKGSKANNVTSNHSGKFDSSFYLDGKGEGKCSK